MADSQREYLFSLLTQIKLDAKDLAAREAELKTWQQRMALAQNAGDVQLEAQVQEKIDALQQKIQVLREQAINLKKEAEQLRRDVPLAQASERSVDTDLLEQEILMSAGHSPDSDALEKIQLDKKLEELERAARIDADLQALKETLAQNKDE